MSTSRIVLSEDNGPVRHFGRSAIHQKPSGLDEFFSMVGQAIKEMLAA